MSCLELHVSLLADLPHDPPSLLLDLLLRHCLLFHLVMHVNRRRGERCRHCSARNPFLPLQRIDLFVLHRLLPCPLRLCLCSDERSLGRPLRSCRTRSAQPSLVKNPSSLFINFHLRYLLGLGFFSRLYVLEFVDLSVRKVVGILEGNDVLLGERLVRNQVLHVLRLQTQGINRLLAVDMPGCLDGNDVRVCSESFEHDWAMVLILLILVEC
mmetsp:Transcript_33661/g.75629  ORF Transcript_33661/g.75629 Transcript_33661/m.75629 type:complete len:212 (-) Transcript_33661:214-849(-)